MSGDYRFTKYAVRAHSDIKREKQQLEVSIRQKHPQAQNFYRLISDNFEYKKSLAKIYSNRCAYCGLHIFIGQLSSFQIDHIVSSDALKKNKKQPDHHVKNLALACQTCNRYKGNIDFLDPEMSLLYPDEVEITKVFIRDKDFYIRVANEKNSPGIQMFYQKLLLGGQLKRVDFLLMNLHDLSEQHPEILELKAAFTKLLGLRSFIPPKET